MSSQSLDVWKIVEIDGDRSISPRARFGEYGPWMSMGELGLMLELIRCANRGEACNAEDLEQLRSAIRKAVARSRAAGYQSPYAA